MLTPNAEGAERSRSLCGILAFSDISGRIKAERDLNIVSIIMVIAGIFQFAEYHHIGSGIACLVFAFLFSSYGLPMTAAWLIAQLMYFRDWLKEAVYG